MGNCGMTALLRSLSDSCMTLTWKAQVRSAGVTWKNTCTTLISGRTSSGLISNLGISKTSLRRCTSEGKGAPSIAIEQFIRGCMRLRCNVKNIDLIAASHEQREMHIQNFHDLRSKIDKLH